MSKNRPHLSRREAERLLEDPSAVPSALGSALASAAAPARAGELRREDSAVTAFHTARLTPSGTRTAVAAPRRAAGARAAMGAVIGTCAVVAFTSGAFALAGSGHLPTLPGQASDRASEAVATTAQPSETSATSATSESTGGTGTAKGHGTTKAHGTDEQPDSTDGETEATEGSAAPTPEFKGLCRAFQATDHSAHGSSLDSAAFTALATEAGGADKVATYCVALIGEPKDTGKPTDKPSPTGKPTDQPTTKPSPGKPTDKPSPTGKPSDQPTTKPTDKPSPGKPTDKPDNPGKGGGKDSSTTGS